MPPFLSNPQAESPPEQSGGDIHMRYNKLGCECKPPADLHITMMSGNLESDPVRLK